MSANKHLIVLAIAAAVAASQGAVAQETAEDSAYQWGRWAVLSPAAGGQPYRAPVEPGADNNYRPGDFFDPLVEVRATTPPVVPIVVTNPGGPPVGDPRGNGPIVVPPVVVPNPVGPPIGDPRGNGPIVGPPVVVPNPGGGPPVGDPRGA